jgi:hypothetical protein
MPIRGTTSKAVSSFINIISLTGINKPNFPAWLIVAGSLALQFKEYLSP